VLAATYAGKVNVIGHSQGGIDARYAVSVLSYGDRVGVLNMVASPHHGSQLADVILEDPTGVGKPILEALLTLMGAVLDGAEAEQDAWASISTLSTGYMDETFNPMCPDDPRVAYKSWAGRTCWAWESCGNAVNAYLAVTHQLLRDKAGDNDGIVPTQSAVWTGFQWVLAADHFDEVGQLAGMTGGFDHLAFYKTVVEAMRAEGF
jgi:triacylglycerol esterase/lipase EstA (alpha/beta hydrolase family)